MVSLSSWSSDEILLLDTAAIYGNEKEIGQAINAAIKSGVVKREDLFVTTKLCKVHPCLYQYIYIYLYV